MKEIINIIPSKDISFRTRSLLSQILGRLELTRQDRIDLEKYITFCSGNSSGEGENLDDIKENLEIFIEYKDKILNIIKDAPEEFDTLIEIFDYIETHITESNKTLEGINTEIKQFPKKEDFATINGMSLFNTDNIEIKESGADATTTEDIQIEGGPLANDIKESTDTWPEDWYSDPSKTIKVIPKNKTLQEILTGLFLKEIEGTVSFGAVSWNPGVVAPTVNLSTTATTLEIGDSITINSVSNGEFNKATRRVTLTATQGYFDGDTYVDKKSDTFTSDESKASGTETISYKWNDNSVNINFNNTKLVIKEDDNKLIVTQSGLTATVNKIPDKTVYASTNTRRKLTEESKQQVAKIKEIENTYTKEDLSSYRTITIKGSYYYFIGSVKGTGLTIDSVMIRNLNTKKDFVTTLSDAGTEVLSKIVVPKGGNTTIIAVPEGYTIKQILALGNDAKAAWTLNGGPKKIVPVTLPDNSTKNYNVFYSENEGGADSDFTNLKLGK